MPLKLPLPCLSAVLTPLLALATLPVAAQDLFSSALSAAGTTALSLTAADTMNFGNASTNQCMGIPKVIGACPAGLVWTYRKPVAVVEVTCKAGQSQLLGGPIVSKLTNAATDALGLQSCGSQGLDKAGNTKPRYYDVHVFRVTSGAYLSPQGVAAKAMMTAACPNIFKSEDLTTPVSVAGTAMGGTLGLIPVYLSELDPLWKNPLPTADGVLNTVVASTVGAVGTAAQEGVCFAAGAAATLGFAPPSMVDQCIGGWGLRSPNTGWVTHKNESIAAMMVAAKAYQKAALVHVVESEIVGKANIFSFVYPPVHPLAPPGSGLRGSGCYTEGTADPRWYSQNEALLPVTDPGAILNSIGSMATLAGVNKGFFVATYWRDTSCCTTVTGLSFPFAPYF